MQALQSGGIDLLMLSSSTSGPAMCLVFLGHTVWVTGQLANTPTRGLPTRRLDILWTGQLADYTTRGLVKSQTGQVAFGQLADVASSRCSFKYMIMWT